MSTMLLNRNTSIDSAVHRQNVQVLLEKIAEADAILVGAAAGMSASCGFNFFYQNDAIFGAILGRFSPKIWIYWRIQWLLLPLSLPGGLTGPSLPEWVTWSMSVPQVSPIMT